jgi:hypothetical protein
VKLKPTLPEGEKNDRLDREELYDRVERHQHVLGRKVEQKQAVEGQADGEVVDDGDVDVSAIRAGKKKRINMYKFNDLVTSTAAD